MGLCSSWEVDIFLFIFIAEMFWMNDHSVCCFLQLQKYTVLIVSLRSMFTWNCHLTNNLISLGGRLASLLMMGGGGGGSLKLKDPSSEPPVKGSFLLELTWTPFPKTLSDKSINQGLLWAHIHSIVWTQKIQTFMSLTGVCHQQKHTQHAPSTKTECDYCYGWIKKWSHTQKSHQK